MRGVTKTSLYSARFQASLNRSCSPFAAQPRGSMPTRLMTRALDPPSEAGDRRARSPVSVAETAHWLIFMDSLEPVVASVTA